MLDKERHTTLMAGSAVFPISIVGKKKCNERRCCVVVVVVVASKTEIFYQANGCERRENKRNVGGASKSGAECKVDLIWQAAAVSHYLHNFQITSKIKRRKEKSSENKVDNSECSRCHGCLLVVTIDMHRETMESLSKLSSGCLSFIKKKTFHVPCKNQRYT